MLNIAKKDGKIINRRLIATVNEIRNKSNQAQTLIRDLSYSFIMPLKENAGNPDEVQTILNVELGYMDTKADMVTELLQGIDAQIERLIEAVNEAQTDTAITAATVGARAATSAIGAAFRERIEQQLGRVPMSKGTEATSQPTEAAPAEPPEDAQSAADEIEAGDDD